MPTISVAIMTDYSRIDMLTYALDSLSSLAPDEVCVLNSSRTRLAQELFSEWIRAAKDRLSFPIRVECWPFDNYRDSWNRALDMCTSEWTLILGSDELLPYETSKELPSLLRGLDESCNAVRILSLDLLDNESCVKEHLWGHCKTGKGQHPRIVRTRLAKYVGPKNHEILNFPGRDDQSTVINWHDHYWIHLWLYKDNVFKRWFTDLLDLSIKDVFGNYSYCVEMAQERILCRKGWTRAPLPEGVTWPIIYWDYLEDIDKLAQMPYNHHTRFFNENMWRMNGLQ